MAKDLTVRLANQPGTLARLGRAVADAGINIDGVAGMATDGEGLIHLLVEDASAARAALVEAGVQVEDERDVLVVQVEDRPGVLAGVSSSLAEAGVNIELLYLATDTRLVLGVSNLEAARQAIG